MDIIGFLNNNKKKPNNQFVSTEFSNKVQRQDSMVLSIKENLFFKKHEVRKIGRHIKY